VLQAGGPLLLPGGASNTLSDTTTVPSSPGPVPTLAVSAATQCRVVNPAAVAATATYPSAIHRWNQSTCYVAEEVLEKVSTYRNMLMEREQVGAKALDISKEQFIRPNIRETHSLDEAQQEKNQKLKEDFSISEGFVGGSTLYNRSRFEKDEGTEKDTIVSDKGKKEGVEKQGGLEAEKKRKYNWVKTPSPSPERSSRKEKKEKKKKKERSRDRSSSAEEESRKRHKTKKSKHNR